MSDSSRVFAVVCLSYLPQSWPFSSPLEFLPQNGWEGEVREGERQKSIFLFVEYNMLELERPLSVTSWCEIILQRRSSDLFFHGYTQVVSEPRLESSFPDLQPSDFFKIIEYSSYVLAHYLWAYFFYTPCNVSTKKLPI